MTFGFIPGLMSERREFGSYLSLWKTLTLADKIAQVEKPTLILWGEADNMLPLGDAEKFQHSIANSELIKLKNCGHAPQLEQPQITSQHILQFLNNGKF